MTEYLSSGEFTGNDKWVGRADCSGGFILEERGNKWAELILPEPKVGMRLQHGPESNPDNKNGKISDRSEDGTRVDVRWDDGSRDTFDYGNKGVIPVTPEFDTGKKVEVEETTHNYKVGQWVTIIEDTCTHRYEIGSEVKIEGFNTRGTGAYTVGKSGERRSVTFKCIAERKLFTIQDLADGKCAVKNDGTKEEIKDLLYQAFPEDDYIFDRGFEGVSPYYCFDTNTNNEWICGDNGLPTQSVKDFVLKAKKDAIDALYERLWNVDPNEKIEVGDTVECIEWTNKQTTGAGWKPGLQFKVTSIGGNRAQKDKCFFGGNIGNGVYGRALKLISKGVSSQPVSESKTTSKEKDHGKSSNKVRNVINEDSRIEGQGGIVIQSRRKRATVINGYLKHQEVVVKSKKRVVIG